MIDNNIYIDSYVPKPEELMDYLNSICDCGGRLAGSESCTRAVSLISSIGAKIAGREPILQRLDFNHWEGTSSSLALSSGETLRCHTLMGSPPTSAEGLVAEVLDLGRGTSEDFEAHADEIAGRIVLVRHEQMFSSGTVHRRIKYARAIELGAVGFIVAGLVRSSLVTGGVDAQAGTGIPAVGVSPEAAARMSRTASGHMVVKLLVSVREHPSWTPNIFFDIPGKIDQWVVVSAHIDGHDLAESAMDNASGIVVVMAAMKAVMESGCHLDRGVRVAFFNLEERGLEGSKTYVESLSTAERDSIVMNINVDSVGYEGKLAALSSGFSNIEPFLLSVAQEADIDLRIFRPLQANSDHANFAAHGIPAFRLVAGFDDLESIGRGVLTELDRRESIERKHLAQAVLLVSRLLVNAAQAPNDEVRKWRFR